MNNMIVHLLVFRKHDMATEGMRLESHVRSSEDTSVIGLGLSKNFNREDWNNPFMPGENAFVEAEPVLVCREFMDEQYWRPCYWWEDLEWL